MKKLLSTLIGAVTLIAINMFPSHAATSTYALDCGRFTVKPKSLTIYCADAGVGIAKMSWSSWGGSTASGTGLYYANNCTPNCASGKVFTTKVKTTLFALTTKSGKRVYTKIKFVAVSGNLALTKQKSDTWALISR